MKIPALEPEEHFDKEVFRNIFTIIESQSLFDDLDELDPWVIGGRGVTVDLAMTFANGMAADQCSHPPGLRPVEVARLASRT